MIRELIKLSNVRLPYNRQKYIDYLDEDIESISDWNGYSLQIAKPKFSNFESKIDILEAAFKIIISRYDESKIWILTHDDKDMKWFPNKENNLISLRELFKKSNISNSYVGSLICSTNDICTLARDFISYSFVLSYKNLDFSHSKLPFIIKITNHLTIDVLSTDMKLLKDIINDDSFIEFDKVKYR
jgi:hypothetical protein